MVIERERERASKIYCDSFPSSRVSHFLCRHCETLILLFRELVQIALLSKEFSATWFRLSDGKWHGFQMPGNGANFPKDKRQLFSQQINRIGNKMANTIKFLFSLRLNLLINRRLVIKTISKEWCHAELLISVSSSHLSHIHMSEKFFRINGFLLAEINQYNIYYTKIRP